MKENNGLIVVGMHRSGTSALTGALHACGATVGATADLTGANAENPKGFFERRDLRQICDALLHSAGADWWKLSTFSAKAVCPHVLDRQRVAFQQLVGRMSQEGTWIVKEPRLCLLLPLLCDLVPDARYVFIYRNPIDVAKSLRTRNGMSLQHGVALWEKYNLSALDAMKDRVGVSVSYHALIRDPQKTLTELVTRLSDLGVKDLRVQGDLSAFVDGSLQRSRHEPEEMAILTPQQEALWAFLTSGAWPDTTFDHTVWRGQRYVLEDLEHQFRLGNDIDEGSNHIRSKRVRALARKLDGIACRIATIGKKLSK